MGFLFAEEEWEIMNEPGGFVSVEDALTQTFELIESGFRDGRDRDPEAARMPYAEYLQTPHWREKRARAMARCGGQCQRCYRRDLGLHVHHMTYDRLGCEAESDLMVLCGLCHREVHGL